MLTFKNTQPFVISPEVRSHPTMEALCPQHTLQTAPFLPTPHRKRFPHRGARTPTTVMMSALLSQAVAHAVIQLSLTLSVKMIEYYLEEVFLKQYTTLLKIAGVPCSFQLHHLEVSGFMPSSGGHQRKACGEAATKGRVRASGTRCGTTCTRHRKEGSSLRALQGTVSAGLRSLPGPPSPASVGELSLQAAALFSPSVSPTLRIPTTQNHTVLSARQLLGDGAGGVLPEHGSLGFPLAGSTSLPHHEPANT